jgi:hypothetical protein
MENDSLPIDVRLLSDAIIELNISRRNVAIYPKGHPSVESSLRRAFEHLKALLELRSEITIAIAKDTLIVDEHYLDRKNPVFREFAMHLSRLNIAYITFLAGVTIDELYKFHKLISEKAENLQERLQEEEIAHIKVGFIDYSAFVFEEGRKEGKEKSGRLLEKYIYGLMTGTLQVQDVQNRLEGISPVELARIMNKISADRIKEEAYEDVITSYLRRTSEGSFSVEGIKKLMEVIKSLRPDLKKQFLSSTVRYTSNRVDQMSKALKELSVDRIVEMINLLNEEGIVIPETLKNLLNEFAKCVPDEFGTLDIKEGLLIDDFFISEDMKNIMKSEQFRRFVSESYHKEIKRILEADVSQLQGSEYEALKDEFSDEKIEEQYFYILLDLVSSDTLSEEDYESMIEKLKELSYLFIETGRYKEVLRLIETVERNLSLKKFPKITSSILKFIHSEEFILSIIDSLSVMGRQAREDAFKLVEYYGEEIIPTLYNALIEEESKGIRRFLLNIIIQLGASAIPEAVKRLGDNRWFVKRNMLYIMNECGGEDIIPYVRNYCHHENLKVRMEALKCLLKFRDRYAIETLRELINSDDTELSEQAVFLAGTFRLKELIPDLIKKLKRRGLTGTDYHSKIPIIRALGDIGDPTALDELRNILSMKSIIYKGVIEKLKEEIYKTLKNYPYSEVKDLVEAGLKSKNEVIKRESIKIKSMHQKNRVEG